uniref:Uncharacterized protein n=1 Tax=Glossina palpalis gambiensis TaxID=67801 RepID=A0A1B0BFL7_9MUSC
MALIWEKICNIFCKLVRPTLRYEEARKAEPSRYPFFNFVNEIRTTTQLMRSNLANDRRFSSSRASYIRKVPVVDTRLSNSFTNDQKKSYQVLVSGNTDRKRRRNKCKRLRKPCRKSYTRKVSTAAVPH